jgi:hypothetical protein
MEFVRQTGKEFSEDQPWAVVLCRTFIQTIQDAQLTSQSWSFAKGTAKRGETPADIETQSPTGRPGTGPELEQWIVRLAKEDHGLVLQAGRQPWKLAFRLHPTTVRTEIIWKASRSRPKRASSNARHKGIPLDVYSLVPPMFRSTWSRVLEEPLLLNGCTQLQIRTGSQADVLLAPMMRSILRRACGWDSQDAHGLAGSASLGGSGPLKLDRRRRYPSIIHTADKYFVPLLAIRASRGAHHKPRLSCFQRVLQ